MSASRFQRLMDLIAEAMAEAPARRDALLVRRCGDDGDLLEEARSLVARADATSLKDVTAALEAQVRGAADELPLQDEHPESIGPYRDLEPVGRGGMGVVYRGLQETPFRREVAVKVMRAGFASAEARARFQLEQQTLAELEHPGIARVYDAGTAEDGRSFFAMEYVDGLPITRYADEKQLSLDARLVLFMQMCEAVEYAHRRGVIHRDLKPANVLVTETDTGPVVKVIDFGVAKLMERGADEGDAFRTEAGVLVGTLEYMSPEQARFDQREIDTRSDVYAMGIILYELLTGTHPFTGLRSATLVEAQRMILETEPRRPSAADTTETRETATCRGTDPRSLRRVLRNDLDWIVMRALEKDPDRRYQAASAMAEDILRYRRGEPVLAGPPSRRYRARKFVRRHRGGVIAASLVFLALVAGTVVATIGFVRATRERDRAELEVLRAQTISTFLTDMLSSIKPEEAQGEDVSVRDVLEDAAQRIEAGELDDAPASRATLRFVIGDTYQTFSDYERAIPMLETALAEARQYYGDEHEVTRQILERIGVAYWRVYELDKSMAVTEELLATIERVKGRTNYEYTTALGRVANVRADRGELEEAARIQREIIAINDEIVGDGEKTQEYSIALHNLASVLADMGQCEEAIALTEECLAIRERVLGRHSPSYIMTLANLGNHRGCVGDYEGAVANLDSAYALAVEVWGPEHAQTLNIREQRARDLTSLERYDEAESELNAVIAAYTQRDGPRSFKVGGNHARLGILYQKLGRLDDAARELTLGYEIVVETRGPDHGWATAIAGLMHEVETERGNEGDATLWAQRSDGGE